MVCLFTDRAIRALVLPYLVWIAGILIALCIGGYQTPSYVYAGKTLLCALLVFLFKPWRYAACTKTPGDIAAGLLFGGVVLILWILPEIHPNAMLVELYRRWFVMMPGALPNYQASWCYAWDNGVIFALLKLIGSAFVIAPIEEFFFRGFFMRWLTERHWQTVPLSAVSRQAFWITTLVFAFEHDRFVVGLLAGIVYGALAVKTNSLRAAIFAHVVTNFLLGLYVLTSGNYAFW